MRPAPPARVAAARDGGRIGRLRRHAWIALALASSVALGACALVKIGYRNGDTVGVFWLDRYLDLNSEQKEFVKPRLHDLLAWHRRTQLPDYAAFGQELQNRAMQSITPAEVSALGDATRKRAMTTVDHALPALAELSLQLTPDNVDAIRKKFAKDDAKWRDDFMSGDNEAQRTARYERSLERIEEWYGRFSKEQRVRIRTLSDARPMDNDLLLGERQRRERDLATLLAKIVKDKPPRDQIVVMMRAYADGFDYSADPERHAKLEAWRRATEAMDAEIHNLATPEQRKRASKKLGEWIEDFRSLSADAG